MGLGALAEFFVLKTHADLREAALSIPTERISNIASFCKDIDVLLFWSFELYRPLQLQTTV